jgi:murein DD-endopeptidase MepM/ murein hydrolase activator NlpD
MQDTHGTKTHGTQGHGTAGEGAILAQAPTAQTRPAHSARARLPWVVAGTLASLFGMVAAFGTVQTTPEPPVKQTLAVEALAIELPQAPAPSNTDFWSEERFQRGDTFAALLERLGIDQSDIELLRRSPALVLRALRPGAIVQARSSAEGLLRSLSFISGRDQLTTVEREGDGFVVSEQQAPLSRRVLMKSAQVRSSLFAATDAADIPDTVAAQLAEVFAGDIDFHRDLRQGDRLSVVYETFSYKGREVKSGRVLAAEFMNQSRSFRALWYSEGEGAARIAGYYTPEGKSLRKAFLRSPLEFSRISSGFGLRMHPIQQRWRQHTGVDYAAPEGTRVKATADGFVEFFGQQSGYGNVIQLRHSSGYTTWYAHLSGFAKGLRRGARVSQGELIGFVGQTGWATGPHLHYEFRVNNQFRNPLALAVPAAHPLPEDKAQSFREQARELVAQLDLLKSSDLALLQ